MLSIINKKFEIEEDIELLNDNNEVEYSFKMQITPNELKKIEEIILDKQLVELNKKLGKMTAKGENTEELENKILEITLKNQEEFENLCFKEHKEPFKTKAGEYKYIEMVEVMFNFFWNSFIGKRTKQLNTMTSDLRKLGSK